MLKKYNLFLFGGIAFLSYTYGIGTTLAGEIPTCDLEPYPWYTAINLLGAFLIPFILGFGAGKFEREEK